jgi:hypothetical protein
MRKSAVFGNAPDSRQHFDVWQFQTNSRSRREQYAPEHVDGRGHVLFVGVVIEDRYGRGEQAGFGGAHGFA